MSAEIRAEAHAVATARRAAGQPAWDRRFNVSGIFHNDDLTIQQKATAIADLIERQRWFDPDDMDLLEAVDGMCCAADLTGADAVGEFDGGWALFYDWCDLVGRVWVVTR